MDRKIEREQKLARLAFGIVVVRARSNRMEDLTPVVEDILTVLKAIKPGLLKHAGA